MVPREGISFRTVDYLPPYARDHRSSIISLSVLTSTDLASKSKSPRRKATSAPPPKKQKAIEEVDESVSESDEETSEEAALWPTSLKCLHHSPIQIHQPPQLPSVSWEEGRRWLSVEEIWILTSRLFARPDRPYLQSCAPPSLRDENDEWEKQSSRARVGSSQKNYA